MASKKTARTILGLGFACFLWLTLFCPDRYSGGLHEITTSVSLPSLGFLQASFPKRSQKHADYYASRAAHDFYAAHSYTVFRPRSPTNERKVYDLIIVNSKLNFLEIRLNTLYNYVNYFITIKSPKTFQGNKKPLAPHKGDVMIVADVDEIPRPKTLLVLRSCNYPRRLTLASKFYYYSFQFLHDGPDWPHPQATYYQGWRTLSPTNLRNGDGGFRLTRSGEKGVLGNAVWHCSSCFPTLAQFLNKIASFSHGWMNRDEYRDKDRIAAAVRGGTDLWERDTETFTRIDKNTDVPPMVLREPERFGYMTSRDGPSAGFTDYP
ncbi:glycosyltransferase family 17 [Beauveria bassiana ARSEF 2860]|uniref:Glycosyltransferase family 17 n=1 Tax=Beauveria bassiana (strain ARSEF 2860) TaxID=655819 RepID=J5JJP9_BEAB2|nr:glycosyltransferase family 17 [Beauveria bassiana ARSEF 2860]EJP63526.1 glycosyltransferase family 17 [Beauveria bassiana ARSEF 2860]